MFFLRCIKRGRQNSPNVISPGVVCVYRGDELRCLGNRENKAQSLEWEITMQNLFARFVKCESGATAIEYGLIASLIGVAIITAVEAVGTGITNTFNDVKGKLK